MSTAATQALERAAEISRAILELADSGDVGATRPLDVERRILLECARRSPQGLGENERRLLREIAELNDRAIGLIEHRQRSKARDLDMVCVGRRAVRAYAANGRHR